MIRNRIVSFIATFSLAGALGGAVALAVGAAPAAAPGRDKADTPAKVADAAPAAAAPRPEAGEAPEPEVGVDVKVEPPVFKLPESETKVTAPKVGPRDGDVEGGDVETEVGDTEVEGPEVDVDVTVPEYDEEYGGGGEYWEE